jgi:VanZ family protein
MEEEEKNKASQSQTDVTFKQNSNTDTNFESKNSDEFRHQENHQKIKINEQKLKDAKEKTMEIKSDSAKDMNTTEEINQKNNNLYLHEKRYYFNINRCLRGKRKKLILIISLVISSIFLLISILDMINFINNIFKTEKPIINNNIIFLMHILYILSFLILLILIIISERKDNFSINLISLIVTCAILMSKIFIFMSKIGSVKNIILNFIICLFLTCINLILLLITLRIIKMKKNEQQNIEEIINFTDIGQGIGKNNIIDKKDNQLMLNSSGTDNKSESDVKKNKDGMTGFVEEINNKEINNNNEQK